MKNKLSSVVILAFIMSAISVQAKDNKITEENKDRKGSPNDFGWVMDLNSETEYSSAYQMDLPYEIYKNTYFSDLSDIRVYDSNGDVVPHMVRENQDVHSSDTTTTKLPFFPFQEPRDQDQADISAYFEVSRTRAVVKLSSAAVDKNSQSNTSYLLDASKMKAVESLSLKWVSSNSSKVFHVDIHGSDNLKSWTEVATDQPLFKLSYKGHNLNKPIIDVSGENYRYYTIQVKENSSDFSLSQVMAKQKENRVTRAILPLKIKPVKEKKHGYIYDTKKKLFVDNIKVLSIEKNSVHEYKVYVKNSSDKKWRYLNTGLIFNLVIDNAAVVSDKIQVGSLGQQWKIEFVGNGGTTPSEIEMHWKPHKLVFMGSGKAPYQLAYGNADISEWKPNFSRLIALIENSSGKKTVYGNVTSGSIYIKKGDEAIRAMTAASKKKFILWIVLAVALAIMMFIAKNLYGQIQKDKTAESAKD